MIRVGSVMVGLLSVESVAWSCFSVGGLLGSQTIIDFRSQKGRSGLHGLKVLIVVFGMEVSVRVLVAMRRLY